MASSGLKKFMKIAVGAACTTAAGFTMGRITVEDKKLKVSERSATLEKFDGATSLDFKPTRKWDYNWDRREPENLVKPMKKETENAVQKYEEKVKENKSKCSRHLLLIRHGQYNLSGETDTDRYLTSLGHEQSALVGRRLQELKLPYTTLVNSTMTRARETADEVAAVLPDVPREQCELIREGAPYLPEPPVGHWKPEAKQFFVDGARIEAGFRKHFHRAPPDQTKDSYEIIVCHANVIRYFVCRALQFPPEAWLRMSLQHASLTHVVIRPDGRVGIRAVGDSGYIPKEKLTVN